MKIAFADRVLFGAAGLLVVAILSTVMAGVVFRGLGHPLSWTDEASGYLMVWLACFGWMIASRRNAHIRIRYFQDKLPRQPWRWTEVLIQMGMALTGAVIAWYSLHLIQVNSDIEAMALPVSAAWLYVPLLPAGLVTLLQALSDLWTQIRDSGPTGKVTPS